jgi:Flp pilus assembly protein TadG
MSLLRRKSRRRTPDERGQAITELVLLLPLFLVIVMGMLEFGIAYDHRTAMAYAVREGARVGASLGSGGTSPSTVDPAILAAVQRGLTDPILIENITSIEIYKSDTSGNPTGTYVNKFDQHGVPIGGTGWPASTRVVGLNGDSIGIRVVYDFEPATPLGAILALFVNHNPPYTTIRMTDNTVMKLEPTP